MPLEIRNLHIKATVVGPNSSQNVVSSNPETIYVVNNQINNRIDDIVEICMDRIFEELKHKSSR